MKLALYYDFTVDKANNRIYIEREFNANLALVWQAWTDPSILDLWWAPKPYKNVTQRMEMRTGGTWLYYMEAPDGARHYCLAEYDNVIPQQLTSGLDAFCDEQGVILESMPRTHWETKFREENGTTFVSITAQYNSLADLEMVINMGFREGLGMAMNNLDHYISEQFRLRAEYKSSPWPRVSTYLNFAGNTEQAFMFYQSVFKRAFIGGGIQRFGDRPADTDYQPVPDELKKMVLHVELPITANHVLMATDAPKEMGFDLKQGNNMHIMVEPDSREETQRIFDALSVGGTISMPLQDMFWGAYFGSLTDQYGINWMISHSKTGW